MVPLRVSVSGNGRQQWFPARIVGFSSRLNTIAVPEQFMEWANARFGEEPVADPSRLIVELSRPGDPAIKEYMAAHDYEMSGDNTDSIIFPYRGNRSGGCRGWRYKPPVILHPHA